MIMIYCDHDFFILWRNCPKWSVDLISSNLRMSPPSSTILTKYHAKHISLIITSTLRKYSTRSWIDSRYHSYQSHASYSFYWDSTPSPTFCISLLFCACYLGCWTSMYAMHIICACYHSPLLLHLEIYYACYPLHYYSCSFALMILAFHES